VGEPGKRHEEQETRIEVIVPSWLQRQVVEALLNAHPYEEVAYDLIALRNDNQRIGSGLIGELPAETTEAAFFEMLKAQFGLKIIRHTPFLGKKLKKIAICGGSGAFLTQKAITAGADAYVTADVKYHEFFEADGRLVLADIGHWESEQFTTDLLMELLQSKFLNFAVLKSGVTTNPVRYFL
jgi:putative NIF3 family GTP cyclohydrolase 1 type 2